MGHSERPGDQRPGEKAWAVTRIVLGLLQIIGATATLFFLIETGTSILTLGTAAGTGLFVSLSNLFFRDAGS